MCPSAMGANVQYLVVMVLSVIAQNAWTDIQTDLRQNMIDVLFLFNFCISVDR